MAGKIAEMVEAEALEAEAADTPDAQDEPDVSGTETPATADAPPAGDEAPSMEALLKAFERENVRHADALGQIMGDDFASFEPCATCDGVGFRPHVAMPVDPNLETCQECKGHGYLLTGSARPDKSVRECSGCQGNGYKMVAPPMPPMAVAPVGQPMFDPYTGERLPATQTLPTPDGSSTWAPGYQPSGAPVPPGHRI